MDAPPAGACMRPFSLNGGPSGTPVAKSPEEEQLKTASRSGHSPLRHFYGSAPSQFGDLYLPAGQRRTGTLVLFHGGWWGPKYGADSLDGAAADLATRGWAVWNVEYRRLTLGGGYPETLADAAAAIDHLATLEGVGTERVVAIGHSAGGHLAVWAAGRTKLPADAPGAAPVVELAGAISLAGVLDLSAAAREKIGKGAAIDLMGGGPDEYAERYAVADPLLQVPIPAIVRCVHSRSDDRVPFASSVAYAAAASAAGQDAQLLEVAGSHFSIADTSSAAWPTVRTAIEELTGSQGTRKCDSGCPARVKQRELSSMAWF
jgi:acetyl esterase/lipase